MKILMALAIWVIIFPASLVKLRNYILKDAIEPSYTTLLMSRITGILVLILLLYGLFNIYLTQQ
ncbi:hypothetical protein R70723_18315 [Paenibacillus sp. FSL R7-0273]|nr:hypothetical protein R70723_18315 [Paenibacillus sp. FSL R7-0273]OMF95817.1 hypothetical protein BK144_04305 [Paenibacillus sp. FSL R7-0273]